MPIYEYACQACGHELEAIQKLSDPPLRVCPACEQPQLRKRISAAGFQLKGSGWYATDFKGGSKKPSDKPEEKSASSGETTKGGGCGGACSCH
jgi:putative FmdB family regulatory protein